MPHFIKFPKLSFEIMRKHILFFLLMVIALNSCKQKPSPLTEEEVINVINKFDDGWRNKNMDAVDTALSPGYVYFTQSGGIFSRDSVVATAGEATYSLENMSRSEWSQQNCMATRL